MSQDGGSQGGDFLLSLTKGVSLGSSFRRCRYRMGIGRNRVVYNTLAGMVLIST